jgi:YD repeat-containing protein
MFEYSAKNQVIQRITVPGNGSNYLIWRYQYDDRGLRVREAIFDKYKQLTGKIEYQYQMGL